MAEGLGEVAIGRGREGALGRKGEVTPRWRSILRWEGKSRVSSVLLLSCASCAGW